MSTTVAGQDLGTERIPRPVWAGAGAAVAAATTGVIGLNAALPAMLALVVTLVVVSEVDTRELRIPNRVLTVAYLAAVPLLAVATTAELPGTSPTRALAGAAALGGVFLALKVVSPAGIGMGDVKLAPLLGAHLGFLAWSAWTTALLATFVVNAVVGVALVATRRAGRTTHLPLGPFMALGTVIAILFWGAGR